MTNPNDPAFPKASEYDIRFTGLTKREYFAAMAMQGMLSAVVIPIEGIKEKLAVASCKYADGLIAELSKP